MLPSRDLVHKNKLRILIDTEAFDRLISKGSALPARIIDYQHAEGLEFIRTPEIPQNNMLTVVPSYVENFDESGRLEGITIETQKHSASIPYRYEPKDIQAVGERILSPQALAGDGVKQLSLAFIQTALQEKDCSSIFVTDKNILLQKRLWLEAHFQGIQLNIVTVNEATEIMDLFLKKDKFYIAPRYNCDAETYYWLSFRSKLPNFHVDGLGQILNAFASRFNYLLMSLDEIGFKYYSEPNKNSFHQTMYHFNYFISLVTGTLDNLAIKTNETLCLGYNLSTEISLSSNAGKNFLKDIRKARRDLRTHISNFAYLIGLVYQLRELVIHREMLTPISVDSGPIGQKTKMNFVKITKIVAECVQQCKDKPQKFDFISEWGRYNDGKDSYLEPFRFAKMVTKKLVEFSNEYLKLLGYSDFIRDKNTNKEFAAKIQRFQDNKLGS